MAKHHKFHRTHMTHHSDGSVTIKHEHEEGPHKDIEHAVTDLDGAHDSIETHLGEPNEGEQDADNGQHGVADAQAGPAGLPLQGAGE